MLASDRQLLLSELKQNATSLKQKEFNLHHSNLMTVGTQAAVLAGLDVVMFIEFAPPPNSEWGDFEMVARILKFLYYTTIISAFCGNIMVVAHTTTLSVLAGSLALRGPDGSMIRATDGLYEERKFVYPVFRAGLVLTVGSVVLGVWLILNWEGALVCMFIALYTCRMLHRKYRRFQERFKFDKNQTVDFNDIFEGPAAIRAVPLSTARQQQKRLLKEKDSFMSVEREEYTGRDRGGIEMMENGVGMEDPPSNKVNYHRSFSAPWGSFRRR